MTTAELRDYQQRVIDAVRAEARSGKKRILIVMPTGAGKTITSSALVSVAAEKGNRTLSLLHRRGLVDQMTDSFSGSGIDTGCIMAGKDCHLSRQCQVASIWTYSRRIKLEDPEYNRFFIKSPFVLIDEAHHVMSKTFQNVLQHYKDSFVVGLTATPTTSTGSGLGKYFDSIVDVVTMDELLTGGFLVPGEYYGPSDPDLSQLKTVQGDYEKKGMDKQFNKPMIIGDIVDNWFALAGDKQTMVFAINRKHAKALCREYVSKGVAAEYLDAFNDDEERDDVIRRFKSGDTQVICQVALYTEGTDIKEIECLVVARPTKSIGLWRQILGRGARPDDGKDRFIVLDHGGNVKRLGFYEDEIPWTLENKKGSNRAKAKKKEKTIMTCEYCSHQFTGKRCPNCGAEVKNWAKKVEAIQAELVQLKPTKDKKLTKQEKQKIYAMLEYHRREKGYQLGWVSHKYKEKVGCWPRRMDGIAPIPPDHGMMNWLKYQTIKWAKSKKRKENKGGFNYSKPYWENMNAGR